MKAGTIVKLPDGREGTVVYNGLDGVGIKWGRHPVTIDDIEDAMQGQNPLFGHPPEDFPWFPDAMLRDPWKGARIDCVGEDYEIVEPDLV